MIETQKEHEVEQIYTKCLSQGSYFIESNGEAAVIDPLRETDPYIERAKERGVKIKYIFETHFHADFVSGHVSLAKQSGAQIIYGPGAETEYEIRNAKDGEEFQLGNITIRAIHTPGHTPESTTYLMIDEQGKQKAIFTGDTLFIGDVGRPDLAQKSTGLTSEDLAGWLYDSLRNKIMTLSDDVIVYPAHGAGSACGKNMSSDTSDTLGNQKKTNYALQADLSKEDFITVVLDGLAAPPVYFSKNAAINKQGYKDYQELMEDSVNSLSVDSFDKLSNDPEVLILDVRDKMAFAKSHIPQSVNIGIDGGFAPWVGEIITNIKQKIVLVAPAGREEEVVKRLSRVGYDYCLGFLSGGFEAWENAGKNTASYQVVDHNGFEEIYNTAEQIIDLRKPSEYASGHIQGSINIPLSEIHDRWEEIDANKNTFIHCRSGYRSTIGASILLRNGLKFTNIVTPFDNIIASDIPTIAE